MDLPPTNLTASASSNQALPPVLRGTLHIHVAFDWGDEIRLEHARRLVPAELHDLARRRRTPPSFTYRPAPLRFPLPEVSLALPEIGPVLASAEATVFDFAAVSTALRLPFALSPAALTRLAGFLADSSLLREVARDALRPLHRRLLPAIRAPDWRDDLSEEYFVFHFPPGVDLPAAALLLREHSRWLAGLLRLEAEPLSAEEAEEALRLRISYGPDDLFIPDWGAALLVDLDCHETLQILEFANLQALEYRFIDNRLDDTRAATAEILHPGAGSWFPFWRSHSRQLRAVGDLKVEANDLFERTGNVLKLVGDQYLARVYRLVANRFHLEEWERSIQRKLEVIEGVYHVVSDQAAHRRTEFLELIIILLILTEIVLSFVRH